MIILSLMDQKDVQKGDLLHRSFAVMAEPGEEGRLFRVFYKAQIPSIATVNQEEKKASSFSFRISTPKAYFQIDNVNFSYQVIEDTGQEQLIELVGSDTNGDYTTWSRYKATKSTVTPLSSRMMGPGEAMAGGFLGLVFASLLILTVNIFGFSRDEPNEIK